MSKAGIKIYACSSETVQDAIDALKLGKLEAYGQENMQTGPGKMGGRGIGGGGRGRKRGDIGTGMKQKG